MWKMARAAAVSMLLFLTFPAMAQEPCTETVAGPPVWSCGSGLHSSGSADFTRSCGWQPGPVYEIEVECPPPPVETRWVPYVTEFFRFRHLPGAHPGDTMPIHELQCALYRMRPASLGGHNCAGMNRHPVIGAGASSIAYRHPPSVSTPYARGGVLGQVNFLGFHECLDPGQQRTQEEIAALEQQHGWTSATLGAATAAIACETCEGGPCPLPPIARCGNLGHCVPSPSNPESVFPPPLNPRW